MGINIMPTKDQLTAFLKRSIGQSVNAGYSVMPLSQSEAFMLRKMKVPGVGVSPQVHLTRDIERWYYDNGRMSSFFPGRGAQGLGFGRGGRGGGGGRGWGRGRGGRV
ncbi:hypothetical protein BDV95DRAFT_567435 [Massariosphaeria phaeospora]|uniref:Uncharacterized protein n=1 Tax=Massariosphaeria phaeospora TaxID=100035 RepID=A0A7C8MS15_9PLEO|nr:hypothetical protein BDV95DRAFT_567435 [Massariosphaeria phaeospora]